MTKTTRGLEIQSDRFKKRRKKIVTEMKAKLEEKQRVGKYPENKARGKKVEMEKKKNEQNKMEIES